MRRPLGPGTESRTKYNLHYMRMGWVSVSSFPFLGLGIRSPFSLQHFVPSSLFCSFFSTRMNVTTSEQVLLLAFETRSRHSPFLSENLAQFVSTTGVNIQGKDSAHHPCFYSSVYVDCSQVPLCAGLVPGSGHLLLVQHEPVPEGILSMTAATGL